MVESVSFSPSKVIQSFLDASKVLSDIPIEPLAAALYEWTILFKQMGKALSIAFSDITEKVAIIRKHLIDYNSKIKGVMSLAQLEISLNLHMLSGENNKSFKDSTKYASGARTTLRLMWFMDFLHYMMEAMVQDLSLSFGKACKKAYKKALEPHHPLLIRTGAKAAWLVAPDRQKFYTMIAGNQVKTESECLKICQDIINAMRPIREALWKFYEQNNLVDLP